MENAPAHKRRGAPAGNTNALKHGFYARRLPAAEAQAIQDHTFDALSEEALILRVIIRRVFEMAPDAHTLAENLDLLRGISHALTSLSRVLRANAYIEITSAGHSQGDALNAALDEVLSTMKISSQLNSIEPQNQS